jgi:signal transduction histidine kinase
LIVAVPLNRNERITGAVRAERSDAELAARVHHSWLALAGLAAFVELVAVAAAIVLSRRLARPLERLAMTAGRLGEGDFSARAPRSGVPEVDRVAIALDSTAQRLGELVTRERAFSADASHQLRTPLAALRIELESMQLSSPESDEIEAALAQVERLQATISTLLDLARDAPRRDAAIELRPRLDQLEDRWRGPLAESGRPLRVACPVGVGPAAISARVLDEVLDVLLSNALTHGKGAVIVRVREVDDSLAIDVQDHGPGFSGDSNDAFGRRATTGEGHGIGLPLAQSLAHAEGCSLSITRSGPEPVLTLLVARPAVNPAISQI